MPSNTCKLVMGAWTIPTIAGGVSGIFAGPKAMILAGHLAGRGTTGSRDHASRSGRQMELAKLPWN